MNVTNIEAAVVRPFRHHSSRHRTPGDSMSGRPMPTPNSRWARAVLGTVGVLIAAAVSACSSGTSPSIVQKPTPEPLFVGGTLTGLTTGSVNLQVTGGEQLKLEADGPFVFTTRFELGASYEVSLVGAPTKAFTTLARNTGLVVAQVRDVAVTVAPAYLVGGAVNGIDGQVVLELNGSERVTLPGAGRFQFTTLLRDEQAYTIAVVEAPPAVRWVLSNGTGTIAGADVDSVAVDGERLRKIGGTVTGLRGGLVLQNNGGDDLIVNADGAFSFATSVRTGGHYDVRALFKPASQRVTVVGGTGIVGGEDVTSIEIVCEDKAWVHPATLDDNVSMGGNDADSGSVASGANGDAIIAWEYGSRLFTSQRRNGTWTHPERDVTAPHNPDGGSTFDPEMAIDYFGNTLMVWSQRDTGVERVYASVFRNGAWQDPSGHADHLSPAAGDALRPRVAVDSTGTGYVVWEQYVSGNGRVFKSVYNDGTWIRPAADEQISPSDTHAQDTQIAVSPAGRVVIVWSQSDNQNYRIYKSELANGSWTKPASLADCISPPGSDAYAPDVAFDGRDHAIVTWIQSDGSNQQVFKAEYRGGTWHYPTDLADNISPDGASAYAARVATSRNGQAVIAWRQDVALGQVGLLKSEYREGTWTHPAAVTDRFSVPAANVTEFALRLDAEGNTVIAYTAGQAPDLPALFMSEYRRGVWTHAQTLADHVSPASTEVSLPRVTIDGNDDVIVLWRQDDGTYKRAFISEYR